LHVIARRLHVMKNGANDVRDNLVWMRLLVNVGNYCHLFSRFKNFLF
jgi:hypothetical protein